MNYDIILILAGGLDQNGNVYEWVRRRLDLSIELFNKKNVPIICLGGGTYHKPPILNEHRFVVHESTACTNYLKTVGKINSKNIYKEWSSYDTIGNAYFSLVNHILLMNIKNIIIITSEFHIERTKLLFNWIYNLENNNLKFDLKYNLIFKSVSDKGLEDMVKERKEREQKSIEHIITNLITNIYTLSELHDWLYTGHNAYSSYDDNIEIISEDIKKTY